MLSLEADNSAAWEQPLWSTRWSSCAGTVWFSKQNSRLKNGKLCSALATTPWPIKQERMIAATKYGVNTAVNDNISHCAVLLSSEPSTPPTDQKSKALRYSKQQQQEIIWYVCLKSDFNVSICFRASTNQWLIILALFQRQTQCFLFSGHS